MTAKLTVSIAEAALMLSVSEQTIARMIRTKKLAASKVDRRILIRLSSIEKMLNDHPATC